MAEPSGMDPVRTTLRVAALPLLLAIPLAMISPSFWRSNDESARRSRVSLTRTNLRSTAVALEAYRADHGTYPQMTMRAEEAGAWTAAPVARTFRAGNAHTERALGLTTPVAYLTSYISDPFAATRGDTFAYFTDGKGWILVSPGPDGDFDLMMDEGDLDYSERNDTIERVYDSSVPEPSLALLTGAGPRGAFTYDPTNGSESSGDVWRVKQ
jgi:hypothetical protein